jgi:hypothetical protein
MRARLCALQVAGTIVRTGSIKMLETSRTYQCCAAQCGATFNVYADREQGASEGVGVRAACGT